MEVQQPEVYQLDAPIGHGKMQSQPMATAEFEANMNLDKLATLIKLTSRAASRAESRRSKSKRTKHEENVNKSQCSHRSSVSPPPVGDTSRFSECSDCTIESVENVLGLPLEPPFILNDHEFEQMQRKELNMKQNVIAGKILPSYKHNVQTEVKLQMVLLSELYGIKKPLAIEEKKCEDQLLRR